MNDRLLIARLWAAGNGGVTEARLSKDLEPIFARATNASQAKDAVSEALAEAIEVGLVVRQMIRSRAQLKLSETGAARAEELFPGAQGSSWPSLKKTRLVAHALGLAAELSAEQVRSLSQVTTLRRVLIAQHLELELPAVPDVKAFERALLWHAMRQGLVDRVYDWAKGRSPTVGVVLAALAASASGVTPSAKKAEVYARYAAKLAGARNAAELHTALLSRLVSAPSQATQLPADGRSTSSPALNEGVGDGFAARVLAAARRSASGKLDDSLVLINHAYQQYVRDNPADRVSLDQFKQRLMFEALDGGLVLASADMPQTLDPSDYSASRIERGASVYALLRI